MVDSLIYMILNNGYFSSYGSEFPFLRLHLIICMFSLVICSQGCLILVWLYFNVNRKLVMRDEGDIISSLVLV